MPSFRRTAAAALLATASAPACAEIVIDEIGGSEIAIEGLLQADAYWFDNDVADLDGNSARDEESALRRAEFAIKGKGPGNVDWIIGYDAKADKFLDAYVRYRWNPFTSLIVGQIKQPNSLGELSSTRFNDFISKASTTNSFAISRRLGVQFATGGEDWTVTTAVFGRELTRGLSEGSGVAVRGTFAPVNEEGRILHLGLSAVVDDTDDDTARPSARPMADLATVRLVDTGNMTDADHERTLGAEAAFVSGPFKLQSEYMHTRIARLVQGDFTGHSGYVYGLWNVTGETWTYRNGIVGTASPDNPRRGMWQLGLRYDMIDLDDGDVQGGRMDSLTLGVNVYLRSNFKFAVNYVKVDSTRRGIDDDPSILEARAQLHW